MRVLGINFGHAPAAVLVEDGKVLFAVEDEKLSRIKGNITFPTRTVNHILEKYRLSPEDIDMVAVGCQNIVEFGYGYRQLNNYFGRNSLLDRSKGLFYDGIKRAFPYRANLTRPIEDLFYASMRKIGFPPSKIQLINHHDAHAASAYYTSPWNEAIIITNDGKGDGMSGGIYLGRDGKIERVDMIKDADSIGQFYQSVTKYLGYKVNRHEGKITGLAAFGSYDETFPLMKDIYHYDNGRLHNTFYDIESFRKSPLRYFNEECRLNNSERGPYIKNIKALHGDLMHFSVAYQMYNDYIKSKMGQYEPKEIAAGIQKLSEEALTSYVRKYLDLNPMPHICLAGGVFANVKINQRIMEIPGVANVYVHPAMDDSGTAFGAALRVSMNRMPVKQWGPLETVYLGPGYTEKEMEKSLKKYGLSYRKSERFEEEIGKMIYDGKIIGRFNGPLEWGPRALGNRSILARPIDKNINDTLNARLQRTEFMPFAPSMLDVDAKNFLVNYNDDHIAAKYMTITYNVRPDLIDQIQAAVHVDGTARPQVVCKKDNATFYRIIEEYKKHSGIGAVINTSFNMHEEPIVNTPDDAIRAFQVGAVDVLSFGPFIVEARGDRVRD